MLGGRYNSMIWLADAGYSGSEDMDDGVTLDDPYISSLHFLTSLDLSSVQMVSVRVCTTPRAKSGGGGVSPCAGSAEWLRSGTARLHAILVHMYVYIEWSFDCSISPLLLYRFMQLKGSPPKEGDNVIARLHVTCPGLGHTCFINCWRATSLRSFVIVLP